MGGGGGNRAPGGRGPGGYGRTSAAGGGSDRQAAPKPAPSVFAAPVVAVTSEALLDPSAQATLDGWAYDDATDRAAAWDDSLVGMVAGFFGLEQEASKTTPGVIDTTWSINPVALGLNLVNPIIGTGAKATGLLDPFDVELASFDDYQDYSAPGPSLDNPREGGTRPGSQESIFSAWARPGVSGATGSGAGANPAPPPAQESVFAGYGASGADLAINDGWSGQNPETGVDLTTRAAASDKPQSSILPELLAAGAIALEFA